MGELLPCCRLEFTNLKMGKIVRNDRDNNKTKLQHAFSIGQRISKLWCGGTNQVPELRENGKSSRGF